MLKTLVLTVNEMERFGGLQGGWQELTYVKKERKKVKPTIEAVKKS